MPITNGLITLEEFQQYTTYEVVGQNALNAEQAIESASRWVEQYTGREFHPTASSARYFDPRSHQVVIIHDATSITAVTSDVGQDGTYSQTHTDYQTLPVGQYLASIGPVPIASLRLTTTLFPIPTRRQGLVKVTGVWGWAAVPTPVKRACATMALDMAKDPTAAFGAVTGDFGVLRIRLNPRVKQLLDPFRRFDLVGGFG